MARIAIVGPGAIGVTVAAALQRTERHRLTLWGRRPGPGFTVRWPASCGLVAGEVDEQTVALPVTAPPSDGEDAAHGGADEGAAGAADLVILAVKSHQTAGTGARLAALRTDDTPVLVLQNGVEHTERLTGLVPPELVVPGIVWCTSEQTGAGVIVVRPGEQRIDVPAGVLADELAGIFDGGPIAVRPVDDFVTAGWIKLVYNAVVAVEALTLRRSDVFGEPGVMDLVCRWVDECAQVAMAAGAVLPAGFTDQVCARLAALPPEAGTSILYDRQAGRELEWDARNGVIRRFGARLGIPTPISDVLVPLLAACGPSGERVPAAPAEGDR